MATDDEEEETEDYFVHLGKKLWRGICSPFRAFANWHVRNSAQAQRQIQAAVRRKAAVAARQSAAPAKRSEDQYTALAFLAGLFRLNGLLSLAYAVFVVAFVVWAIFSTDGPREVLNATFIIGGVGSLVGSFVSFAIAAVIRLMIDAVMTLREIRDK